MPVMPTTRRGRYLQRRERYLRRARRAEHSGWTWATLPGVTVPYLTHVRTGRKHRLTSPGPTHGQDVSSAAYDATPYPPDLFSPPVTFTLLPATNLRPPHVHLTGSWRHYVDTKPGHLRRALIGYHRRRTMYWGHRPWRMNGFQRKCWGAAYVAYSNGYFPDWDPLGRHPTLDEVDAGADPYFGPFPQTPGR
jgi:hypothetical protein